MMTDKGPDKVSRTAGQRDRRPDDRLSIPNRLKRPYWLPAWQFFDRAGLPRISPGVR